MLKEKIVRMLNENGAGIVVACDAADLTLMNVSVEMLKGKMKFTNISKDGEFPITVHKFDAKGYMDGMSDVKGDVLRLTGHFGPNFAKELRMQVEKAMSTMNEDIFKPDTGKEIQKRRLSRPITISFELEGYQGELSDVSGGGYVRGGPGAFGFEWKDVGIKAYFDNEIVNSELEGFVVSITGKLNGKRGVEWYDAIFNPPDYDPDAYDSEQFGNDPETTMPEEMYWDMYWEDMRMEWGAR